jgi:hypothetical protein
MQLLDYVQLIANRVCNLVDQITTINNTLATYNTRITNLENKPEPTFIIPSVLVTCDIGNIAGGTSAVLENVLTQLINGDNGYCALISATGSPTEIINAVSLQTVGDGDVSIADCGLTMQQKYSTSWISNPTNLSESLIDVWIAIQDLRNGNKLYNVIAGNSNVTVTSTTSTTTCGTEKSFDVKAKSASVIAGTNITVATNTTDPYNTEYTVNATSNNTVVAQGDNTTVSSETVGTTTTYTVNSKEAIVTASTNTTNTVTVTPDPGPGSNDTTYSVYSKYGLDTFSMVWVMVGSNALNTYSPWMVIPPVPQDVITPTPILGCGGTYTSTGYSIPQIGGGQLMIKPNVVQTTAATGANINKNVVLKSLGMNQYVSTAAFTAHGCTFGTYNGDLGVFTVTQPGIYTVSAYMHLKSICSAANSNFEGQFYWSTNDGHIGLGIVVRSNDTDIYCGNVQTVIANKTTQIDISATRTAYIGANSQIGINVLNVTDRTYTPIKLNGSDAIGFSIIKVSEDFTEFNV